MGVAGNIIDDRVEASQSMIMGLRLNLLKGIETEMNNHCFVLAFCEMAGGGPVVVMDSNLERVLCPLPFRNRWPFMGWDFNFGGVV